MGQCSTLGMDGHNVNTVFVDIRLHGGVVDFCLGTSVIDKPCFRHYLVGFHAPVVLQFPVTVCWCAI